MIDEVLEFWFGEPATEPEGYGRKMRRWFMGGPTVDAEIRERFGSAVEAALAGELVHWSGTREGRLALILLLDQFTRSIYRNDPRSYAGDAAAQALALEALDRGLDRGLGIEQRHFLMMPLLHAEDLAMQERAVVVMDRLVDEAPAWQQPVLGMGREQTQKYRDIIARFGRFPHRNAILDRPSTPEEQAFLVGWEDRARPRGVGNLPS